MYCPKCGKTGMTKTAFCSLDGTQMKEEPKCECGNDLWIREVFCDKCGKPNTNKYIEEIPNVI
jgi:hypothetical protein